MKATITWRLSSVQYTDDIRIDTGADVSVLPFEVMEPLGLNANDAIYEMDVITITGEQTTNLVFLVDFELNGPHMGPVPFHDVHVIFSDTEVALFGIWTALEHVPQLVCDFPGMRTFL